MTGSHQKTCVFGALLCIDGRQFFRQDYSFNQYCFLDYLIQIQKRFGKLILFIDRARQHHRSAMVRKYIKQSKDSLKVIYFLLKNAGDKESVICWYQNTIQDLRISDMP